MPYARMRAREMASDLLQDNPRSFRVLSPTFFLFFLACLPLAQTTMRLRHDRMTVWPLLYETRRHQAARNKAFRDPLISPGSKSWLAGIRSPPVAWNTTKRTRKDPADPGPTLKSSSHLTGLAYLPFEKKPERDVQEKIIMGRVACSLCVDRRAQSSSRPL